MREGGGVRKRHDLQAASIPARGKRKGVEEIFDLSTLGTEEEQTGKMPGARRSDFRFLRKPE